MSKALTYALISFALLGALILFPSKPSSAVEGPFAGVVPFATVGGFMGFFNQADGKVYLYDENLQHCVQISQLDQLGNPMITVVKKIVAKKP